MESTPTFEFNGHQIPVEFGYKEVIQDFKKLGLNLLEIYQGDRVLLTIMTDDAVMINVWYHYVKDYTESFEKAIEHLTPKQMQVFKEAFWQQTVNFTPSQMRPYLQAMRKEVEKALKSPENLLKVSSPDSSPKQE